jgi:ABC-type Fe3+/spermidine/putrescine transport system ATPase subunit
VLPRDRLEVLDLSVGTVGARVLDRVTFSVRPGELVVLMGPNGSGKTTLLRAIAGLQPIAEGDVRLAGTSVSPVPPHRRGIGMVFQDPSLFPRRSVEENIAYGLEVAHRPDREVSQRVGEMLRLLRIEPLARRDVGTLSGGERHRVALARTLAPRPPLVLLDEPFTAFDPEVRTELRSELRRVLADVGASAVFVTHDREEGLFLGDRVLLLFGGRIRQTGTPTEVFSTPASREVASFLGYNVISVDDQPFAVHPEDIRLGAPGVPGLDARVVARGSVGTGHEVHLEVSSGAPIEARLPRAEALPPLGSETRVTWRRAVRLPE